MANFFSVGLFLVALISAAETLAPSPQPSAAANQDQDSHLRNILDALIGSGDYGGWANLLSSANPSELPLTATLFIPSNDAISGLLSAAGGARLDPLLVPYHIVPQRLTFSELQDLTPRTRLPTLLPANFILLTNNSTLDGAHITQPDIFLNAAFALHGVDKVLNYSVFGAAPLPPPQQNNASLLRNKKKTPPRPIIVGVSSASCPSCATIPLLLSIFFHVLHIQHHFRF